MSDNATLNQRVQLGMQATYATALAATKKLQATSIEIDPQLEMDAFTAPGFLFPGSNSLIQEWTEGDIGGVLTYTEVVYPLSMLLGAATITTPDVTNAPSARQWKWAPAADAVLSPVAATLEKGSTVYGVRVPSVVATGFNIGWSRTDRIEIGGSIMGARVEKPFTPTVLTGATSVVEIVRVIPPQVSVFVDTTFATLGTTRQLRAFSANVSLDDLYGAVWPLNATLTGHDGIVPTEPSSECGMTLMANAAGLAFLDNVRAGQTVYIRIDATGPLIGGAISYKFTVDICAQVNDMDAFSDEDGIYSIPWTFQPVSDGTNPPISFTVVNKQAAL